MKRYRPTNTYWDTDIEVECPYCKHQAWITGKYSNAIFTCNTCYKKEKYEDKQYYSCTAKCLCPECFNKIEHTQENIKEPKKEMNITCEFCKHTFVSRVSCAPYYLKHDANGLKAESRFGYPLWLQTTVKGKRIWAYNRSQLANIESFIEADIREDERQRATAWLPKFMITAKNRDAILKAIKRMREK